MKDNLPRYTLRIPKILLDKLGYVAEYERKIAFIVNFLFVITSVILIASLIYIGVTQSFSVTVIISVIVMLCVGIHSIKGIIERRK